MTDNEIVKALEHCLYREHRQAKCTECKYVAGCKPYLLRESLDLINRQKADIEGLSIQLEVTRNNLGDTRDELNKAEVEIERLNKEHDQQFEKWLILSERTKERYADLYEEAKGVVRAEAIKEFAERLKAEMTDKKYRYVIETIYSKTVNAVIDACIFVTDNLVKEMTEET